MITLNKKYKIVYSGNKMVLPLTEEGTEAIVYVGKNCEYAEFDEYDEAKKFIDEHNLTYTSPEELVTPISW